MHPINDIINCSDKVNDCQPYNSCFYSSFVFVINILVALHYSYYLYAGLFFTLLITSLLHHSHYNCITNALDKIAIYCVVFYGGHLFYTKIWTTDTTFTKKQYLLSLTILITFISTIAFYYYGYLNGCLCFSINESQSYLFHSLMHCIVTFGHCCIMVL
jgi:hypothetical protein